MTKLINTVKGFMGKNIVTICAVVFTAAAGVAACVSIWNDRYLEGYVEGTVDGSDTQYERLTLKLEGMVKHGYAKFYRPDITGLHVENMYESMRLYDKEYEGKNE